MSTKPRERMRASLHVVQERTRAKEAAGYVREIDGGPVMFARVFGAGMAVVAVVGCAAALWALSGGL